MKHKRIVPLPALFIVLSALFITPQSTNAQTAKYLCNISIQQTENNITLLTPASDKILFSKIIIDGMPTFTMQLQAFGSELNPGKGVHIVLTSGKEFNISDVPIDIGIPDNDKVAFKYTGIIKLTYLQTEYLKNDPVKEYSVGNFRCILSAREQKLFFNYFNCLCKDFPSANPVTKQPNSTW